MSTSSPERSTTRETPTGAGLGSGRGGLQSFATRRPGRVLAVWGVVVLVSLGLVGTLLGSGLTSDSSLTNHPESAAAQDLIDARMPTGPRWTRSSSCARSDDVVSDAAFRAQVRGLVAEIRRSGGVTRVSATSDPGGEALVSQTSTPR